MSRIGSNPVLIPKGVDVTVDGQKVTVKGPKGELKLTLPGGITIKADGQQVVLNRSDDEDSQKALHGLNRTLVSNMITGANQGFSKSLDLVGTGYRVLAQGKNLTLYVGFTHQVVIEPLGKNALGAEGQTRLVVSGPDKETVGRQAAEIRRIRPPNAYTGKGIRFAGEQIKLKPGKSAAKGAA